MVNKETLKYWLLTNPDNEHWDFDDAEAALTQVCQAMDAGYEMTQETRDTGFGTERKIWITIKTTSEDPQRDVDAAYQELVEKLNEFLY